MNQLAPEIQRAIQESCNEVQREIAELIARNYFNMVFPPPGLWDWLAYNERATRRNE